MSKVTYLDPIKSMHGKLHCQSDTWLMERHGTQFTGHRNNPRDYRKKPQSEAEKAGTLRMAAATKAYNELAKGSPEGLLRAKSWSSRPRMCQISYKPGVQS